MDMEKYIRLVDDYVETNCNVKEDDIMKIVNRSNKKKFWKPLVSVAACVAVVFLGTTVSYATGLLDLDGMFKKLFKDDQITSQLIEEGAVEEVNLVAQDDKYRVTFEGYTGDANRMYGLFKLVDKTGELENPSLVQLAVKIVGMSEAEEGRWDDYSTLTNYDFVASEEEDNAYFIKVGLPSYLFYTAEEDVCISLEKFTAYYGEVEYFRDTTNVVKADNIVDIPFSHEWTFTPEKDSIPNTVNIELGQVISSEHGEFTVRDIDFSRYETSLVITFPTNEEMQTVHHATAVWHRFDNDFLYEVVDPEVATEEGDYRITSFWKNGDESTKQWVKTVKDPTKYNEGEVKLFVDGVEQDRINYNSYRWVSAMDSEVNPTYWGILINYAPIDVEAATSIEIRYMDQVITVK